MKSKTVIPISHQLSTIARIGRIIVAKRGSVVECDKYTELIE